MILAHDLEEVFFERETLRSEFEYIDIGGDQVSKNCGQAFHGISRKKEVIIFEVSGVGPLRETGKNFGAKTMGAYVDVDFAFGRGVQIAGTDDLTVFDDDDGVAGDFNFTEEMRVKENGGAALAFIANDVANEVAAHGVEAGSGFIEEDKIGFVEESLRETDTLHHPFRKAAQPTIAMRGETDKIKIGGDAVAELGLGEPGETTVKNEKFGRRKPVVKTKIFGKEADLLSDFDVSQWIAENLRLTTGGFNEAEKHFDGSAFTGTVGAKEAEYFASANLEREPTNGDFGAELLAKVGGFDGEVVG